MGRGEPIEMQEGWEVGGDGSQVYRKLNLGCGPFKIPGYLNVDNNPNVSPNLCTDLEKFPWSPAASWPEGHYHEVVISHMLEHVNDLIGFLSELYRVCANGAIIRVTVPYFAHQDSVGDPTHKRHFCERSFAYFSVRGRKEMNVGHYNFPFDFESERMQFVYEPVWEAFAQVAREHAHRHHWNVVREMTVYLRAHKPARVLL